MTPIILDQWDYQLILSFKRFNDHDDLIRAKKIWAERNKIKEEYVRFIDIVYRLEEIRDSLICKNTKVSVFNVLLEKSPYKSELWTKEYQNQFDELSSENEYWARLLLIYASIFRNTETKYFLGLEEYYADGWLKNGNP